MTKLRIGGIASAITSTALLSLLVAVLMPGMASASAVARQPTPIGVGSTVSVRIGSGAIVQQGAVIGQAQVGPTGQCDTTGSISVGPSSPVALGEIIDIKYYFNSHCQAIVTSASVVATPTAPPGRGIFDPAVEGTNSAVAGQVPTSIPTPSGLLPAGCVGEYGWVKTTELDGGFTGTEVRHEVYWNSCGGQPFITNDSSESDSYCYANPFIDTDTFLGSCAYTIDNYSSSSGTVRASGQFSGFCNCSTDPTESSVWSLWIGMNIATIGPFYGTGGVIGDVTQGSTIDVQYGAG